jgi:hypothetical protein
MVPMEMSERPAYSICFVLLSLAAVSSTRGDEAAALASIEQAGGRVRRVAASVPWTEVSFHLCSQPISDEALAALRHVPELRWLQLQGTQISDDSLRHLSPLTQLTRLHLERTPIGDKGVAHLAGLTHLEYLNLYGTQVSDQSIDTLARMTSLKNLYVWQTGITDGGIARLREALPKAEVVGAITQPMALAISDAETANSNQVRPTLATGRFVRVELLGEDRILQLAEVEVFAADSGEALHTKGTASQSSTAFEGDAARAIDGNTNARYQEGSVSHTGTQAAPWWEVDLGNAFSIGLVRIWNRGDCCGDRLQGGRLTILDADRHEVYSASIESAATGSRHEFPVTAAK